MVDLCSTKMFPQMQECARLEMNERKMFQQILIARMYTYIHGPEMQRSPSFEVEQRLR
jgi:hypothetical protein